MSSKEINGTVFKTTNPEACYTFKWIIEKYSNITDGVLLRSPDFRPLLKTSWYATFQKKSDISNPHYIPYGIILYFYNSSLVRTDVKLAAKILDISGNLYNECCVCEVNKNDATVAFQLRFKPRNYKSMFSLPKNECVLECNMVFHNYNIQTDISNCISLVSSSMSFGSELINIYRSGDSSDVTLNVQGSCLFAHKVILSARSDVFKKMFQTDMKEKATSVVEINDTEPLIINLLLEYMYSGVCPPLEFGSAQVLFRVADKYCVLELKQVIVDFLLSQMTVHNAVDLLFFAQSYDEKKLKEAIISFIKTHKSENHILKSFHKFMDGKYKSDFTEVLRILL